MKAIIFVGLVACVMYYFFFRKKTALLVIDMQNDFCPGGSLAVTDGDSIIAKINQLIRSFVRKKQIIVFSRDWHPEETNHFKSEKNPNGWPKHCVQYSYGAAFHHDLLSPEPKNIVSKGMGLDENAYSAFDEKANIMGTNLHSYLISKRISTLVICGLATDWCVKQTALDALNLGYKVMVIEDAIKAVNINPIDGENAITEMKKAGAVFITPEEII